MKQIHKTGIAALAIAVASGVAHAQFVLGTGAAPAVTSPNSAMPAGKIYINLATIPRPRAGTARVSVIPSVEPITFYPAGGNGGQFRVGCSLSHMSFDDPIVYPGRAGMTHLHAFFGNTQTRASSDLTSFTTTGKSTCSGGIANRTGYWAPPLIYHCPEGSVNGCNRARDGEVQIPPNGNFYYKTSGEFTTGQWYPVGHRMIVGQANATVASNDGVRIECYVQGNQIKFQKEMFTSAEGIAAVAAFRSANGAGALPGATGCDEINFLMGFPDCWDGVNLDSPDHRSHMAYPVGGVCPAGFPAKMPNMTVNLHTYINNADLDYLRLSSDPPLSSGQRAGYTLHTDRVEGFLRDANFAGFGRQLIEIIGTTCLGVGRTSNIGTDCHNDNLGSPLNDGTFWRLGP